MKLLYYILLGFAGGTGVGILIYIFSTIQMRAWITVIEEHLQNKYTKTKKEDNGNKEK